MNQEYNMKNARRGGSQGRFLSSRNASNFDPRDKINQELFEKPTSLGQEYRKTIQNMLEMKNTLS